MEICVLVDNQALIDRYFLAEPGLSLLIRDEELTVLFDAGYSDAFLQNALALGHDLIDLDAIVLSHNHLDHTWGLVPLIRYMTELKLSRRPMPSPYLVAHPDVFLSVSAEDCTELGSLLSKEKLAKHFPLQLSPGPKALSSRLTFLGEIPRGNDFEALSTFGRKEGAIEKDLVLDDSALVYRSSSGLVIIAGCAHAGICNTIEYAKEICGDDRVLDIVGGLHLQDPTAQQLEGTLSYLGSLKPAEVHACHCTDLASKIALSRVVPLREVGVGMSLHYDP